jgi:hypothetical protein
MAKGGSEVVCDLREWPGSTMMVPQDDFRCVVTVAATETITEYYYYGFLMLPCPILGERAAFGYG